MFSDVFCLFIVVQSQAKKIESGLRACLLRIKRSCDETHDAKDDQAANQLRLEEFRGQIREMKEQVKERPRERERERERERDRARERARDLEAMEMEYLSRDNEAAFFPEMEDFTLEKDCDAYQQSKKEEEERRRKEGWRR